MKRFSKVLFLSLLLKANCGSNYRPKAFSNISEALAATNHEVAVISVNGSSDFVEAVVLPNFSEQKVPHSVMAFKDLNSPEYRGIDTSAVIAFDSIDSLKDFNNETYTCRKPKFNNVTTLKSDFYYPFQFFVYCHGMTKADLLLFKDNPPPNRSIMLQYEYFIVDEVDFINLWTFFWFTQEKCDQMQLVRVNQFSKKTQKWEHDTFVIEKFANFHGCRLRFYFFESFPSYITKRKNAVEEEKDCVGFSCEAAHALGKKLNYTYVQSLESYNANEQTEIYDIRWDSTPMQQRAKFYFIYSTSLDSEEVFVTIPPGKDVDSYERIVRPFDVETWMWVAITFITAFVMVFIVKFTSMDIKNFIIGPEAVTPGLNILRIFLGISQIRCPTRNFARFLVMSFILFCVVIRTAYQAKMFQFLQMELKNPTFDTIDELIENNFTFYLRPGSSEYYNGSDFGKR